MHQFAEKILLMTKRKSAAGRLPLATVLRQQRCPVVQIMWMHCWACCLIIYLFCMVLQLDFLMSDFSNLNLDLCSAELRTDLCLCIWISGLL